MPNDESFKGVVAPLVALRDARDWKQSHAPRQMAAVIAIEASELEQTML